MYADDSTLSTTLEAFEKNGINSVENQTNNELEQISEWLNVNKLSLNVNKTKWSGRITNFLGLLLISK